MGQPRKITVSNGAVTVWQSDTFGRVRAVWTSDSTRTQYTYDLLNRLTLQTSDAGPSANPLGAASACNPAEFICAGLTAPWQAGFPSSVGTSTYIGQVGVDSVIAPGNVPRSFEYNAMGLTIRERDETPSRQMVSFIGGSGLVDSVESRSQVRTVFQYDAVGRRTRTTYPRVITLAESYTHLAYTFDTIPGDTVTYQYDLEGRLLQTRSLNLGGGTVSRTYWANGSLRTRVTTTPFLDSLRYWYDATGAVVRKEHVTYTTGLAANAMRDAVEYAYHPQTGRLASITTTVSNPTGVPPQTLTFDWDGLGRRRRVTYPTGWGVNYRYDTRGTLRKLWTDGTSCDVADEFCVAMTRDSVDLSGRILAQRITCHGTPHDGRACGASDSRAQSNRFYRNGWLASQLDGASRDSLVYGPGGNILRRWRQSDQAWHALSYETRTNRVRRDSLEQGGGLGGVLAIAYTADGSRRGEKVIWAETWQQQLQRDYRYDALGRLRGMATRRFVGMQDFESWFEADACQYDPEGKMIRACGAQAKVTYDDENVVASNETQWHFIHGPALDDPLIALGQKQVGGPVIIMYMVNDGAGNAFGASLSNGTWDASLNATGTTGGQGWQQSGGVRNGGTMGEWRQGNSNTQDLAYFRNRVYDMRTGQWTQEDPLGLAGGLNLYQYSGNNPVGFSDPWGLCPKRVGGDGQTSTVDDCSQEVKDAWQKEHVTVSPGHSTDLAGIDSRLMDAIVRTSMTYGLDIGISAGKEPGHSEHGDHDEGLAVDINVFGSTRFNQMNAGQRETAGNWLAGQIVNRLSQGATHQVYTPAWAFDTPHTRTHAGTASLIADHWNHIHITIVAPVAGRR